MQAPRMVPLADADTEFEARVLVAKLGSAGIVAEVRGVSAIYPTMATAQVWVEDSALDDARELITTPDAFPVFEADEGPHPDHRRRNRWLVAVALVLLASFGIAPRCAPMPDRVAPHAHS